MSAVFLVNTLVRPTRTPPSRRGHSRFARKLAYSVRYPYSAFARSALFWYVRLCYFVGDGVLDVPQQTFCVLMTPCRDGYYPPTILIGMRVYFNCRERLPTVARTLCHCVTSPCTTGSHPRRSTTNNVLTKNTGEHRSPVNFKTNIIFFNDLRADNIRPYIILNSPFSIINSKTFSIN